jgi:hypothetical protein
MPERFTVPDQPGKEIQPSYGLEVNRYHLQLLIQDGLRVAEAVCAPDRTDASLSHQDKPCIR